MPFTIVGLKQVFSLMIQFKEAENIIMEKSDGHVLIQLKICRELRRYAGIEKIRKNYIGTNAPTCKITFYY